MAKEEIRRLGNRDQLYLEIGLCDERCRKCIHNCCLGMSNWQNCDYILNTGHRRPCPAGEKCTVFKPKTGKPVRKNVVIKPKVKKKCIMCHQEFWMGQKQKYCEDCYKRKEYERNKYTKRGQAKKRMDAEMAKDKVCGLCGTVFHSTSKLSRYCPDCKSTFSISQIKRMMENKKEG